eukprot:766752-Hanusia_phi.AAC.5
MVMISPHTSPRRQTLRCSVSAEGNRAVLTCQTGKCLLNEKESYFSCTGATFPSLTDKAVELRTPGWHPDTTRICPCRAPAKEQAAVT